MKLIMIALLSTVKDFFALTDAQMADFVQQFIKCSIEYPFSEKRVIWIFMIRQMISPLSVPEKYELPPQRKYQSQGRRLQH